MSINGMTDYAAAYQYTKQLRADLSVAGVPAVDSRANVSEAAVVTIGFVVRFAELAFLAGARYGQTGRDDLVAACQAAVDWVGLDGDGISEPTRSVLLAAVAKAGGKL